MNAINPLDDLDFTTVTEADFENLTIDDLLGNALSDVDLSSGLPDGTFVGYTLFWDHHLCSDYRLLEPSYDDVVVPQVISMPNIPSKWCLSLCQ